MKQQMNFNLSKLTPINHLSQLKKGDLVLFFLPNDNSLCLAFVILGNCTKKKETKWYIFYDDDKNSWEGFVEIVRWRENEGLYLLTQDYFDKKEDE